MSGYVHVSAPGEMKCKDTPASQTNNMYKRKPKESKENAAITFFINILKMFFISSFKPCFHGFKLIVSSVMHQLFSP